MDDSCLAVRGRAGGLVELGRVQDSIRLGVGGTVARHLSRPSAWLELPLATADACERKFK